jgi:glycosyltransferase involved in cell wall biosynthesis
VAKRIRKFYRRESEVIYPGVDVEKYYSDKKGNYFLIVSRLSKYKNIELAVRAFNDLGERLLIIGSGPERKRLERIAKTNIEFLGFKSDETVRNYYSRARAFIFPQIEDFGLTSVEAIASGVPVIALKEGGALETIEENKTGIFFKKETVNSLKKAVKNFIDNKEKKFNQKNIKSQAQKFSKQNFKKCFKNKIEEIINE